jgi:hypothetical protein
LPEISAVAKDSSPALDGNKQPAVHPVIAAPLVVDLLESVPQSIPADVQASDKSTLFLGAAALSESWFAANKYILAALLVVAVIIGVIVWLR